MHQLAANNLFHHSSENSFQATGTIFLFPQRVGSALDLHPAQARCSQLPANIGEQSQISLPAVGYSFTYSLETLRLCCGILYFCWCFFFLSYPICPACCPVSSESTSLTNDLKTNPHLASSSGAPKRRHLLSPTGANFHGKHTV